MKAWLFSVFVMTPLAIIQTLLFVLCPYFLYEAFGRERDVADIVGFIIFSVVALLLLLGVNKIVRLIRFGGGTWVGYNILDFIVAPLRFPLILITNLIAFIDIFADREIIDAREEPDLDDYSFFGCVGLYLLHIVPEYKPRKRSTSNTSYSQPKVAQSNYKQPKVKQGNFGYKLKVVAYQFATLLITVVHSPLLLFLASLLFEAHEDSLLLQLLIIVATIFIYALGCTWSATLKGVKVDFDYWDPDDVKRYTVNTWDVRQALNLDRDPTSEEINQAIADGTYKPIKTEQVNSSGWKSAPTFGMILYFIFGLLMVIVQSLVFLWSIILLPIKVSDDELRTCTVYKARLNSFGAKLRYFFLGIAETK